MSKHEESQPKIGEGHASAMFRQGLRELRGALYPESNVAQPAEYGLYGTKTPGEVAEARRADERDPDEEPAREGVLDKWMGRTREGREDQGRAAPELERE
jgi:hypothetical protein